MSLLDLDQNLIVSICRVLSVRDKLRLQMVNKYFQKLLNGPVPGAEIWGVVDLHVFNLRLVLKPLYRRVSRSLIAISSEQASM